MRISTLKPVLALASKLEAFGIKLKFIQSNGKYFCEVKGQGQQFLSFVDEDMNVSISTDDPGVFANSLNDNYELCTRLGTC